ncbi:ABC transporter ATP-binding protein [Fimbriiglobus ruber]|uniref:ABC transporter, ATP-binding protein n=1 Tax=Fimbriiglobus ruber TaxID=1908690 RepID=A0A225D661_9BACT|nr:ABC transporter ATP-binding protein [Fimbriiglobus ruber]OWK35124.1 ABC transporter, ATP-binding protein [Fimbriiglobus ruber]
MTTPILDATDVHKSYGRSPALAGVSLAVSPGELFGLLGPNGAGKTTLLSILSGLTNADRGAVSLFGKTFDSSHRDLRRAVGLATQDLAIYPELTARENLTFFGKLYGMRGGDLAKRVDEMLAAVALTDRGNDRAGTFSGGMKRRLNLAVSVVHRPQLLLLDEPTTGVDPQSRNHIFEQVKALNAAGLTVIYTSHYMEEVQSLCPRIAILDAGRVMACDTRTNLLKSLDAIARVHLSAVPPGLVERIAVLPGVKHCTPTADGLELTATDVAPVLPKLIAICTELGAEPTALNIDQPNLERVFLHLTGRGLRD